MAEVRFAEEAEAEYTEALAWYRACSGRAAVGFATAVEEMVEQIRESPERFPTIHTEDYRFALLARYPYSLIYRVVGPDVRVVAVAHVRRRPGYWASRV